jgi:hypothetical protein
MPLFPQLLRCMALEEGLCIALSASLSHARGSVNSVSTAPKTLVRSYLDLEISKLRYYNHPMIQMS